MFSFNGVTTPGVNIGCLIVISAIFDESCSITMISTWQQHHVSLTLHSTPYFISDLETVLESTGTLENFVALVTEEDNNSDNTTTISVDNVTELLHDTTPLPAPTPEAMD